MHHSSATAVLITDVQVVCNWFVSKGVLPIACDVLMTGRGGMLWQSIWPAQWQASNQQRQFLHQPKDLELLVSAGSTQRIEKVNPPPCLSARDSQRKLTKHRPNCHVDPAFSPSCENRLQIKYWLARAHSTIRQRNTVREIQRETQ